MFNTTKNSKNLSMLSIAFMLCIASLLVDCGSGGGGGGGTPAPTTCQNGSGAVGACESCDAGFNLSSGACVAVQVTVTFHLNEGAGTLPAQQTVTAGQEITVPNLEGATRAGFTFIGWSTLRTDVGANFVRTGATYTIPRISIPSQTLTLYATWGQAYTVTYNLNGGMGSAPNASSGVAGAEVTLRALTLTGSNNNNRPANASASPNNGFFGWGVNPDGLGQTYNAETSQLFASNTTLFALWYYSISYHCGEGTATTPANFPIRTTARTGEVLTNLALTGCSPNLADGRTFAGWSTTGNTPYIITMPNGPITLRAVYAVYSDGDGDGLIEITSADRLNDMRYNLAGTSWKTSADDAGSVIGCPATGCRGYELTADIDLGNTKWGTSSAYTGSDRVTSGWEPIGICSADSDCTDATDMPFAAIFEGRGYVIRNLYINRPSNATETGLFGAISGATLNHVTLVGVAVYGRSYTGALVGYQNSGSISNSYTTGVVRSRDETRVGGLVGLLSSGTISNSFAASNVTGPSIVGGLVGQQDSGNIINSYATGAVRNLNMGNSIGGLVGNLFGGTISNSYATGNITSDGGNNTGGLVGYQNTNTTITNSYATGAVTAIRIDGSGGSGVGGLVGTQFGGTINYSYSIGNVMGDFNNIGGLVGLQNMNGTINNSYATGDVTGGNSTTGGLVGLSQGSITTSYWNSLSAQTVVSTARSEAARLGIGSVATSTLTSTANGVSALSTTLLQSNTNTAGAIILSTSAFYVVAGGFPKLCYAPLPVAAGGTCSATYRLPGQD